MRRDGPEQLWRICSEKGGRAWKRAIGYNRGMLDEIDPAVIADPAARALLLRVLNLVDQPARQLRTHAAGIQRLCAAIARRKGAQGRPHITPRRNRRPPAFVGSRTPHL